MFLGSGLAYAETYLDSAHGNATNGVDRKSPFPNYAVGNCAHCHEQHASIDGVQPNPADATPVPSKFCLLSDNFSGKVTNLYAQSDSACFYCHYGTGTLQGTAFPNYSYSITFGGSTDATPATIFDAFNNTSYHNLNDVLNFAKGASGWSSTFTANSNPCSACHNVHIAQRSCGKPTGSYDPAKSAISKPSDHGNLWGNDTSPTNERMNNYTYVAPFYVGAIPANSSTKHEPDGANYIKAGANGANVPNYIAFCTDCHNSANSITSTTLGRTLKMIDWGATGDQHGDNNGAGSADGNRIAPYTTDGTTGTTEDTTTDFVLSCMNCHEPHGSSNEYLLRTTVNGTAVSITTTGHWYNFCSACHELFATDPNHSGLNTDSTCNNIDCHYHRSNF